MPRIGRGQVTHFGRADRDVPCQLCDGHEFRLISRQDRRGGPLETVICERCGLISHGELPSDEELQRYYAARYRKDYHGQPTPAPHRIVRAWNRGQLILKQLRPYLEPGDRVFEVGAGLGCTVKAFELAGYESAGIEPGAAFQQFARQSLRAHVEQRTLAELPRTAKQDFILLVHVIEHLNYPRLALDHIRQLLRPGGRVYIACPNVAAPHAAPGKLFHYAHIHNFTHDTLAAMARTAGLDVVDYLSDERDLEIGLVLKRAEPQPLEVPPQACERTLARVFRHNIVSYHLRSRYLQQRAQRLVSLYSDRVLARRRMRRILELCAPTVLQPALPAIQQIGSPV